MREAVAGLEGLPDDALLVWRQAGRQCARRLQTHHSKRDCCCDLAGAARASAGGRPPPSPDAMRVQLVDLLKRRSAEEARVTSTKKAEIAESLFQTERKRSAVLQAEVRVLPAIALVPRGACGPPGVLSRAEGSVCR
jgi:hypothetical protein